MRASPYDLSEFGYPAIPIETEEGRAEYVQWQEQFSQQGKKIREMLLAEYDLILEACKETLKS